ncbi:MAG: hypothetical protein KDC71_07650 [Acidobacteria bacterium]|nr:hypothetical protein [Acidobacteriota bacterium]
MRLIFMLGCCSLLMATEVISHGEEVELSEHLTPGKYVLFDFYADWCGPCRSLDPVVKQMANNNASEMTLLKVDIRDWSSPVARQYGINSIPHLKLYSPEGKLISEGGARAVLNELDRRLGGTALPQGVSRSGVSGGFGFLGVLLLFGLAGSVIFVIIAHQRSKQTKFAEAGMIQSRIHAYQNDPRLLDKWCLVESPSSGTYSLEDLRSLFLSNRLNRETKVKKSGEAFSRRLGDVLASY